MAMPADQRSELETLAAAIARSEIFVERAIVGRATVCRRLPAGFEPIDAAILAWLAAEARRFGRDLVRM